MKALDLVYAALLLGLLELFEIPELKSNTYELGAVSYKEYEKFVKRLVRQI